MQSIENEMYNIFSGFPMKKKMKKNDIFVTFLLLIKKLLLSLYFDCGLRAARKYV